MFDLDGRALLLTDDDLLQVFDRLDEADAADEELDAVFLQHLRAHIDVRLAHGLVNVHERDPVGAQFVGVNVDLILLHEAADAGDFAHAFDGVELVAEIPVLDGTQFGEVEAFRLDGIPKDLAERGGVGAEHRRDAGRAAVAARR